MMRPYDQPPTPGSSLPPNTQVGVGGPSLDLNAQVVHVVQVMKI
jgi:hypothetical protein